MLIIKFHDITLSIVVIGIPGPCSVLTICTYESNEGPILGVCTVYCVCARIFFYIGNSSEYNR